MATTNSNVEEEPQKLRQDPKHEDIVLLSTSTPSQKTPNATSSKCEDAEDSEDILDKGIESGLFFDDGKFIKCTACNKTCAGTVPMMEHITSESHVERVGTSSSSQDSQENGSQSLKLPEEIADIIVIAAHESLDNLFSNW